MKGKLYVCTNCKEKFSRKWNANRHNKVVHSEMAIIFNTKTGSLLNYKGKDQRYNNSGNVQQKASFNKSFKNLDNSFSPVHKNELESEEEIKITSVFGKLKLPFEELEKLISDQPENIKIKLLSDLVTSSLMSPNPVKSLQGHVDFYQSVLGKQKIIKYVSRGNHFTPSQSKV